MYRRPAFLLLAAALLGACGTTPATTPKPRAASGPQAQGIFNQPVVIESWLNEALSRYDHDRSGAIDLKRTGWFARDERERHETVRREERDEQGRLVRIRYTTYTYSLRDLFYAADRDVDLRAQRPELLATLGRFDEDGNGELSRRGFWGWVTGKPKGEWDKFKDAYGERMIDVEYRDIDVNDRAGQIAIEREAPVVSKPTVEADDLRK